MRTIADSKDLGNAGAAVIVGQRLHRAVAARHEPMGAAQRARQFGRRGKAVAQSHDVSLYAEVRCLHAADAVIAQQPRHTAAPVQNVAQAGGERQALDQQ